MTRDGRTGLGWFRASTTLAVMLSIVAASIAEDGAKGKKAAKTPDGKLPEIVRTEES